MTHTSRSVLGPIGLALALGILGAMWNLAVFNERALARRRYQPTFVDLPRPEVVRVLSCGFTSFAADWYWIKGMNYFGDQRNVAVSYGELYNYMKLVVDLDPKYFPAYLFGGYALPWNRGDRWVNTQEAADLLERGIREFPSDWRLRLQLAYVYSAYLNRYKDAGDQLAAAAAIPGAPPYAGSLATRMYATVGDLQGAEVLAKHIIQETQDGKTRQLLLRRLLELEATRAAKSLTKASSAFKARTGRYPESLDELAHSGTVVPPEPLGGDWKYEPRTGTVSSSVLNERLTIFSHSTSQSDEK